MKNKYLITLFSSAVLSGCTSLEEFSDRYPRAFNLEMRDNSPQKRFNPYSQESLDIFRRELSTEELFQTRPKPRPPKDVRIVDFQKADPDTKDACTQTQYLPVARQGGSDSGNRYTVVIYDIDQNGRVINPEADLSKTRGGTSIAFAAINGVKQTRFEPPILDGERLYCKNVTDHLAWYPKNIITNVSVRILGSHHRQFEW